MKRFSKNVFVIVIVLFFCALPGLSQTVKGSISGLVMDTRGATVPGARVRLRPFSAPTDITALETKTDDLGKFNFEAIDADEYVLAVTSVYFPVETERLVTVREASRIDITIEIGRGCGRLSDRSGVITDDDKAQVVRLALAMAVRGLLPSEERHKGFVLSTKYIEPQWISDKTGTKIKLMKPENIQRIANDHGDFLYISFSDLQATGACIAVSVDYSWAVGNKSRIVHMDSGVIMVEFRKVAGKWVGTNAGSWVS